MSANENPGSVEGREFHNRVPPSEPLTRKGHAPGVLVGNERVPEFHAETHPAGTAPREATFQPNPEGEIPGGGANAADTLGGATSQDVYKGMGKPMQGQEEREIKGVHTGHRKKEGTGLAGHGAAADIPEAGSIPFDQREGRVHPSLPKDYQGADESVPASAEEVASERKPTQRAYDYTQSS